MFGSRKKTNKVIIQRVSLTLFFCLISSFAFAQTQLPISSATASSYYSSYTAAKTIDNNLSTYWRGSGSVFSKPSFWWLKLNLGKNCSLNQISIWWHKDYGSTNYSVQGSVDNKTWTNLYTGLSSAGGSTNPYQKNYNLSGSYRYIRLYINKAQKFYPIIYEVKLYGQTDATPPQISITSPANNSTVSGTVDIQAQATDNVAVAKVDFYVDETLKSSDTTSPYSYSWDTTTVSNGNHTLKAIAYDTSNNSSQGQISVNVNNLAPPPQTQLPISSATASSYYSSYTAAKTIDNNLSTYWRGSGSVFSKPSFWWLKLNLGKNCSLNQISIWWHKDYGSTNYSVQGSVDNKTWTNLYTGLSSAGGSTNPYQKNYNLSGSYRYIRLYINKAQKFYPIIYEVKLYSSQTLSISIDPKSWSIGSTQINKVITMAQANKITVTNDGSGPETLELKLINPSGWTASTVVGRETYCLSGLLCNSGDVPLESHFNQSASNEDVITTESKKATSTVFAYDQSTANGASVPSAGKRSLYLQFKSPTITEKKDEQDISVIVSCQTP